ncbi:MAG: hypothetical protein ABMA13_15065 [Chthoniobacteraceae bacterium]
MLRSTLLVGVLLFALSVRSSGDVPLPGNILDPKSAPEAWNVIRLATENVAKLILERRLSEVAVQMSLCSPALRALGQLANTADPAIVSKQTTRALGWVVAVARTASEGNASATEDSFKTLKTLLLELGSSYDPKVVSGEIYFCPMHADFVSPTLGTPCERCGMALFKRRIPYSFIYTAPGEPSITMAVTASAPVEAGKRIDVKVRLARMDKSPLLTRDLMVMHTEPIHLLIEEPGLGDFHHEHPVATGTPGEYSFSFTPTRTSPYRIWADIVPGASGVQELPHADLASSGQAGPIQDKGTRFTSTVDGYQFAITLTGGNHIPIAVGQTRKMAITVTDAGGQPVRSLEPFMNAFAHVVGFFDDYETVVQMHPSGGDILNPEARGGPAMGFQFFPPKAGFIRLYCKVKIGGKMIFAPFNLNVVP